MFFNRHEQPDRVEDPASDLQVPGIAFTPPEDHGARTLKGAFDRPDPLGRRLPQLAPDGKHAPAAQFVTKRDAPPPGRETVEQPPIQPRQGLEQVEEGRQ